MTGISVRNIFSILKDLLPISAVERGRSMEDEAGEYPCQTVGKPAVSANLGETIHRRFAALGGVDLKLPPREPMSEPSNVD